MENKKADAENKSRNLYCTGTFSRFTYWNYDRIPSKNDALAAALDWIDIAEAVSTFFIVTIVSNYSHCHDVYTVLIIFLVTFIRNIGDTKREQNYFNRKI